jgi:signal transduction histidine kinase
VQEPTDLAPAGGQARKPWLGYANLRLEAAVFLLVAVSFAAVLGKSAITNQTLVLSPQSGRFVGYGYSDAESGGGSTVAVDPARPLSWSCEIRRGTAYPYCGYGLDLARVGGGLDFSHLQTATLRFSYQGPADRLRLIVKPEPGRAVRDKLKGEPMHLATDIPVVQGHNVVRVPLSQLAAEDWWLASHGLTAAQAAPDFKLVQSVAIATSGARPGDRVAVTIEDITFQGAYLSTEQFYLIILGVWLVGSAGFLVYRFLHVRHDYEARQRQHLRRAQLLADAHAEAEAASNAKSRFLGNMSHELRTPLNAIIGYTYWLGRTELNAKQRAAVKTVQASGEHLLAVISDILDVAKIEAGTFDLLAAPFDLHACVEGVGEMFRLPAEEKGLDFAVEVAPGVPRLVEADEKRVRQVLINLVGNAVKFTSDGRIDLRVVVLDAAGETARLAFVVEDTGVGIPADQLESVFRPFEQAGEAVDRNHGTGLGLSISRQIVTLMRGEIGVESTLGQGSRFTVQITVPISRDDPDALVVPRLKRLTAST